VVSISYQERFYRDWISDAPDELTTIVIHAAVPAMPVELHGRRVVMVVGCYVGDLDEGDRFVRPLRNFGTPLLDLWKPKPFVAHQAMFDPAFPHGRWNYFRSCNITQLTDQAIDIVEPTRPASSHRTPRSRSSSLVVRYPVLQTMTPHTPVVRRDTR
jgi:hypothetical protein